EIPPARAAPRGPVVFYDRLAVVQDLGLEGSVGYGLGSTHGDGTLPVRSLDCYARSCSASHRSASIAAEQPVPAAVMACRYTWSTTSPQAKTPSIAVRVVRPSTSRS